MKNREIKTGDVVVLADAKTIMMTTVLQDIGDAEPLDIGEKRAIVGRGNDGRFYLTVEGYGETIHSYPTFIMTLVSESLHENRKRSSYTDSDKTQAQNTKVSGDIKTEINTNKGEEKNMLKTTIEGKLAILSGDGFYYSVTNSGSMKREYTVFENISEPIKRERTSLNLGDILEYEGQIAFCSMVTGNQYSLTKFQDKSVVNIQKGDELDDLGVAYKVIINPIQSILDADKSADATTLLSNNPNNAQKLSLTLQQQQNSSLGEIARALKGFKVE